MITHTVVAGDSIEEIAKRYYGQACFATTLAMYNNLEAESAVHAGQKILIPPFLYSRTLQSTAGEFPIITLQKHYCVVPNPEIHDVSFSNTVLYCGDAVSLVVTSADIAASTPIDYEIIRVDTSAVIDRLNGRINNNTAHIEWISQMPPRRVHAPRVKFSVRTQSNSRASKNELEFKGYPDIPKETKTLVCKSGMFAWSGKFDISMIGCEVVVLVKIKLINRLGTKPVAGAKMPPKGAPVSAADKNTMKADIESKLSGAWVAHRRNCRRAGGCGCSPVNKCCKIPLKIVVDFVESGQHHEVNLFQGAGQANAKGWTRIKTRANSWAHETGHLLGWYDEYVGGAVGAAPHWVVPNSRGIMDGGLSVPQRYYWDFRDWLNGKSIEQWVLQ